MHSITCTNYWTLSSSLGQHLQRFTIVKRDQVPCHPNHPVTVQLMWRCKKCNSWWFDTGGISPNFFSLFSLKYMLCYVSKNSEMSFYFFFIIVVLLFWLVYICFGYFYFSSFIPFHIILFNFIVLFNFYIKYNTHSFKYCFFNPFLDLFFSNLSLNILLHLFFYLILVLILLIVFFLLFS